MKKILILLGLLIGFGGYSQNPDYHRYGARTKFIQPDTLSTAQRTALTPKLGTLIYHKDTGVSQWEQWNGSSWEELSGTDENAIHDNEAGEINAITEKVTPVSADQLIMEDSENGFVKRRVAVGNLPFLTSADLSGYVTTPMSENLVLGGFDITGTGNIDITGSIKSTVSDHLISMEGGLNIIHQTNSDAVLIDTNGIDYYRDTAGFNTALYFPTTPIGNANYFLPTKAAGTYTLATTDDITGGVSGAISNEAYNATTWDGVDTIAPSKNAVRDKFDSIDLTLSNVVTTNTNQSISGTKTMTNGFVISADGTNSNDVISFQGNINPATETFSGTNIFKQNDKLGFTFDTGASNKILYFTGTKDLTAPRTVTWQDKDGVVAYLSDIAGSGSGDMLKSTYDPTNVAGDAFSMDNMVEGTDTKILTAAERSAIASNTAHTSNTSNPHSVTKTQVGLGNVDNTSDANKPISTATQSALDAKISSDGTGRTNAEEVSNQYAQSRADYATDGAPSAGTWVFIKDPLNGEELTAGSTTIDFVDANGYATPYIFLDNTTDDETSFTLTDMRELDVVEIYLNQATEPSFTPTVDIVPDTLDWTADSLASTDVTLTVWRDGLGNYQGVYTKRP